MRAGSGRSCRNTIASKRSPARASSSRRCFSPTIRWLSTSNASSNGGGGNPWPQTSARERARERRAWLLRLERAVGFDRAARAAPGRSCSRAAASNAAAKRGDVRRAQRQAGGGGVAAEADRSCPARAWRRDRARRAGGTRRSSGPSRAELAVARRREHDRRAMEAVLEPAATMPTTPWCHSGRRGTRPCASSGADRRRRGAIGERFVLHRRLDVAPLAIEAVESAASERARRIVVSASRQRMPTPCRRAGRRR